MRKGKEIPAEFQHHIERLIQINDDYSRRFQAQALQLQAYKETHPTKIMVFKCMDGRILFSSFTGTPLGFLRNFRNLGGQFNFGWRALRDFFTQTMDQCYRENRGCLCIITYHYSKGDKHRGCAGYNYDIDASIRGAMGFQMQLKRAYKHLPHQLEPIVVGIETDDEALILHGRGEPLEISKISVGTNQQDVFSEMAKLYPEMSLQMRLDLLPLVMNNILHTHKVKELNRPIVELDHGEWIVAVGGASSLDFLHVPNTAIIVGQYNPNLGKIIQKALGVIKSHWKNGNKFLSLAGASYGPTNLGMVHEQHALEDVRYYNRLIREVASEYYPELVPHMFQVRGLLNIETQKIKLFWK